MALFDFLKIRKACKMLNLIDRGYGEAFVEDGEVLCKSCAFCRTRARIDISKKDGQPMSYCWRCIQILRVKSDYAPHFTKSQKRKPKKVSYLKRVK